MKIKTKYELIFWLIVIYVSWLVISSCQKNYIEKPTCYRYLEISDKFDADTNFIRSDTLYPNGKLATYVCNEDTLRIMNYKPFLEGCVTGGFQIFRYVILK